MGPTIRDFDASPSELTAPGDVVVRWDVARVTSCTLRNEAGNTLASGSGLATRTVAVDVSGDLTLSCSDGNGNTLEQSIFIIVGPTIQLLDVTPGPFSVFVSMFTAQAPSCELRAEAGDGFRLVRSLTECSFGCSTGFDWNFTASTATAATRTAATSATRCSPSWR